MTGGVPLTIALVAGGISTLNPCSFPLLPAFLSFYVGAEEEQLPKAPSRMIQGVLTGMAITVGYLGVFALVSLPITYGITIVADALPWLGIAIGVTLVLAGLLVLTGRSLSLPLRLPIRPTRERRVLPMLTFGAAYGTASLGCALPLFLALVGSSLGADGAGSAFLVFLAFAAGSATMLIALSVSAALAREGLVVRLRQLVPQVNRLAAALLVVAGAYLTYYWLRLELGSNATLASDPVLGFGTRFTARLQSLARGEGRFVLLAAVSVVAVAVAAGLWQQHRRQHTVAVLPTPTAPES